MLAMSGLAAWDVIETRKFRSTLVALRASGAPVTEQTLRQRPSSIEALTSDRYLRLAATRSVAFNDNGLLERVREAERAGQWPEALAAEARQQLRAQEDALDTIDRAVRLQFQGLSPGAE